jgi:hypothetical protein
MCIVEVTIIHLNTNYLAVKGCRARPRIKANTIVHAYGEPKGFSGMKC